MNNLDDESRKFLFGLVVQYNNFLYSRGGVDEEDRMPLTYDLFTPMDQLRVVAALARAVQSTDGHCTTAGGLTLEELVPALDEEQLQWLNNAPQL